MKTIYINKLFAIQKMKDYKKYNDQLFSRWAPVYDVFELILSDVRNQITKEINPINKSV
jgi:hypothetical protein